MAGRLRIAKKNIMDAAVVGTPISSLQPTQLTFEDGFGERRYAIGTRQRAARSSELSSVLSSVSSFDFALRERAARLAGFRHESYARVRSIELDRRTSALVVIVGLCARHQAVDDPRRGAQAPGPARDQRGSMPDSAAGISRGRSSGSRARSLERRYRAGTAGHHSGRSSHRRRVRAWRRARATGLLAGTILEGARRRAAWLRRPPQFDARADVTQIGAVALALILGRPLTTDEYPERLPDLIQGATLRSVMGGSIRSHPVFATGSAERSSSISGNCSPPRPRRGRRWTRHLETRTRLRSWEPFTFSSPDTRSIDAPRRGRHRAPAGGHEGLPCALPVTTHHDRDITQRAERGTRRFDTCSPNPIPTPAPEPVLHQPSRPLRRKQSLLAPRPLLSRPSPTRLRPRRRARP